MRTLIFWMAVVVLGNSTTISTTTRANGPTGSLHPHASWSSPDASQRIVLVHGFGSRATSLVPLANRLSRDGFAVATFQYDSRAGVEPAASQLSEQLQRVANDFPTNPISIVSHSMGGLVARWMLEQTDRWPTKVNQLIMVAPPNAGSALASIDASTLVQRSGELDRLTASQRQQIANLDSALSGMLGLGVGDLRPDSTVLQRLAVARIPATVRYSVLAGSDGPMPPETSTIRTIVSLAAVIGSASRPAPPVAPLNRDNEGVPLDRMLASADQWLALAGQPEWVSGQGDGVVSIQSTRLRGVSDHTVLPIRHNTITGNLNSPAGELIVTAIEDRLRHSIAGR